MPSEKQDNASELQRNPMADSLFGTQLGRFYSKEELLKQIDQFAQHDSISETTIREMKDSLKETTRGNVWNERRFTTRIDGREVLFSYTYRLGLNIDAVDGHYPTSDERVLYLAGKYSRVLPYLPELIYADELKRRLHGDSPQEE